MNGLTGKQMTIARLKMRGIHKNGISYGKEKNKLVKLINQEVNVWYKLCCYYQATTELYDRKLTDLRSPYDSTEAYIINENRRWSTIFSVEQRRRIMEIAAVLEIPKSIIEENGIRCGCNFSAQGWIDQYEHLVNIGEMDFMNNIKN